MALPAVPHDRLHGIRRAARPLQGLGLGPATSAGAFPAASASPAARPVGVDEPGDPSPLLCRLCSM